MRERARGLKRDIPALGLALFHPRTPRMAKVLAVATVAYALSPIDLIPDFIPVLGLVDDMLLLPLAAAWVVRLIPAEVMDECRRRAAAGERAAGRLALLGLALVLALWLTAAIHLVRYIL